ncbi:heat shock protein 33 [Azorhizobium caulinodans ORS 571]|uniref:Heat shock protein 33 n=1 Tax=Azorhizobium caulinodans (strain ATCC 43989 / DSM 5975 / JCM 20966 / LMG 6465 / NBRC 14845 / NCIMB 13405 / ORS 571) TaxID=438753 RepID=A8ILF2_AZOC5|nr:Hsp33 family molecular chaperone [Azorhizobium caulinodans]BAF90024.1 heat shock protein 33 [Azorhizobium caulinodans ORS 571]
MAEEEKQPRLDADDCVTPFQVEALDVRGRVVRLGSVLDGVLAHHTYPAAVKRLIGEAVVLATLLGSSLKFEGRFILQTHTDGPVDMLVVDFVTPDKIRAYARFDREAVEAAVLANAASPAALLGKGHLAMTIDQGLSVNRYQGVVALTGEGLEEAAHEYFRQSEQIPTRVRLAVGEELQAGGGSSWRAGGLLAQFLPAEAGRAAQADFHPGDAPEGTELHQVDDDEAWAEAQALAGTIEDVELVDKTLTSDRLLFRLFHERGVRVFEPQLLKAQCSCSRERVAGVLKSFTREEQKEMVQDDGRITVTCEFCGRTYGFAAEEVFDQLDS